MNLRFKISVCTLLISVLMLLISYSCKKSDNNINFKIKFNHHLSYGTLTDIDDNVYKTITIGSQTWMAENLKVIHYNNGDLIKTTNSATSDIISEGTPEYRWAYNGNESNARVYGRLYTWFTVNTGILCPQGWHVPTYTEWNTLVTYLGVDASIKLKETGTIHWVSPNTGITNESGFTALPGGYRMDNGQFVEMGENGFWHSSTDDYNSGMFINSYGVAAPGGLSGTKSHGYSIRCLKDGKSIVLETLPVSISSITSGSAIIGGNIISDGGYTITERGVCWGTSQNPDTSGKKLQMGNGSGLFKTTLYGLNPKTAYYVRVYAINSQGTFYGSEKTFNTPQKLSVTTSDVSNFTLTSVTVGGNIPPLAVGEDGTVIERGVFWGTSQKPELTGTRLQIGKGTGTFSTTLSGLSTNAEYFVRAYAINFSDTAYGEQISFKTLIENSPVLSTVNVTSITRTTAVCGGIITSDGGFSVTECGVFYGTSHHPETTGQKFHAVIGSNTFSVTLSGLIPGTEYFVRAYATNINGTAFGSEINFRIAAVTDIDGNIYNTVTVTLVLAGGTYTRDQVWMKENLRVTRYNDGTVVPLVTDSIKWSTLTSDGYSWYNNDSSEYKATYGALYNLQAVKGGKLCPAGWRQALYNNYKDLTETYGGPSLAGGKLKSVIGWMSPNTGATDESGFSALPGGSRSGSTGRFINGNLYGFWSEPTIYVDPLNMGFNNTCFEMDFNNTSFGEILTSHYNKNDGFSVRCVKEF